MNISLAYQKLGKSDMVAQLSPEHVWDEDFPSSINILESNANKFFTQDVIGSRARLVHNVTNPASMRKAQGMCLVGLYPGSAWLYHMLRYDGLHKKYLPLNSIQFAVWKDDGEVFFFDSYIQNSDDHFVYKGEYKIVQSCLGLCNVLMVKRAGNVYWEYVFVFDDNENIQKLTKWFCEKHLDNPEPTPLNVIFGVDGRGQSVTWFAIQVCTNFVFRYLDSRNSKEDILNHLAKFIHKVAKIPIANAPPGAVESVLSSVYAQVDKVRQTGIVDDEGQRRFHGFIALVIYHFVEQILNIEDATEQEVREEFHKRVSALLKHFLKYHAARITHPEDTAKLYRPLVQLMKYLKVDSHAIGNKMQCARLFDELTCHLPLWKLKHLLHKLGYNPDVDDVDDITDEMETDSPSDYEDDGDAHDEDVPPPPGDAHDAAYMEQHVRTIMENVSNRGEFTDAEVQEVENCHEMQHEMPAEWLKIFYPPQEDNASIKDHIKRIAKYVLDNLPYDNADWWKVLCYLKDPAKHIKVLMSVSQTTSRSVNGYMRDDIPFVIMAAKYMLWFKTFPFTAFANDDDNIDAKIGRVFGTSANYNNQYNLEIQKHQTKESAMKPLAELILQELTLLENLPVGDISSDSIRKMLAGIGYLFKYEGPRKTRTSQAANASQQGGEPAPINVGGFDVSF